MYFVEYWLMCSFQVSCQFNAKSGAINQLTLGDRLVDHDQFVGHPWLTRLLACFKKRWPTNQLWMPIAILDIFFYAYSDIVDSFVMSITFRSIIVDRPAKFVLI